MKRLLVFLLMFSLFVLSSCKEKSISYDDLSKVTYEGIFDVTDKAYIVIAYQANCPNCDNLLPVVNDYYKFSKKNKWAMPIYSINVNLTFNKDIVINPDDTYPSDFLGAKDYRSIKVKATPSIIVIDNQTVVKVISDFNTRTPVTDGKAYFKNLMQQENK